MTASFHRQSGVTLVELMISLTLGLIVLLGVIQIFSSGQQAYNETRRFGELQAEISLLQDMLTTDIRAAQNIVVTPNGSDIDVTINYPVGSGLPAITYQYRDALKTVSRDAEALSEKIRVTNISCLTSADVVDASCGGTTMQILLQFELIPSHGQVVALSFSVALRNNILNSKFG